MSMERTVRVSVRNLVEFLMRSGDIDTRMGSGFDREAMLAGGRMHRKIQKGMGADYRPEVPLSEDTDCGSFVLRIEGRADGVFTDGAGLVTVDEIKGSYEDPESFSEPLPVHLAQAKCYAAMLVMKEDLAAVGIQMTYVSLETEKTVRFSFSYNKNEIREWMEALKAGYVRWAEASEERLGRRNASMRGLTFPFPYREGQKALVASVYRGIRNKEELFLMAPTGVGKTLSVLYPSVRALGEGLAERIFYLTARNQTLAVPAEALGILKGRGLSLVTVTITAKEKICPFSEARCNPEECSRARGHFDRVNEALFDALAAEETFDAETIRRWAAEREICPFEFSLDLALFSDAVLCDYNYAFDPDASLKRFFGEGARAECIFLVDEAHNLVDRAREMFSASLVKEEVLAAKKLAAPLDKRAGRALEKLNKALLALKKELPKEEVFREVKDPGAAGEAAVCALEALELLFKEKKDPRLREDLLDFYFSLRSFVRVYGEMDGDTVSYTSRNEDGHLVLSLRNVDPSGKLQRTLDKGRAAVFFSATLLPVQYYKGLLTTRADSPAVYAKSPFSAGKRCVVVGADVTARYRARGEETYERTALYIREMALAKRGNYLAFFPSYRFLAEVLRVYREKYDCEEVDWVAQGRHMDAADREIFLENFYENPARSLVGFTVLGGSFAEGIDLVGSRLVGALIVGTGLPQVGPETELLRRFFDARMEHAGFDYAYRFPGMNKVLQAAGRVIRTEEDRGVVVLLDERFLEKDSLALFPREWEEYTVCSLDNIRSVLDAFWKDAGEG
ncbi:MAG: ATP-dependent DNA helicase [Lachnospiraceae bacterium]|nr:ATP-dependent DNA helicase [Lachnospiraceae bacterium]